MFLSFKLLICFCFRNHIFVLFYCILGHCLCCTCIWPICRAFVCLQLFFLWLFASLLSSWFTLLRSFFLLWLLHFTVINSDLSGFIFKFFVLLFMTFDEQSHYAPERLCFILIFAYHLIFFGDPYSILAVNFVADRVGWLAPFRCVFFLLGTLSLLISSAVGRSRLYLIIGAWLWNFTDIRSRYCILIGSWLSCLFFSICLWFCDLWLWGSNLRWCSFATLCYLLLQLTIGGSQSFRCSCFKSRLLLLIVALLSGSSLLFLGWLRCSVIL